MGPGSSEEESDGSGAVFLPNRGMQNRVKGTEQRQRRPSSPVRPLSAESTGPAAIATSLFSFTYSQGTSQILSARLAVILRSLESLVGDQCVLPTNIEGYVTTIEKLVETVRDDPTTPLVPFKKESALWMTSINRLAPSDDPGVLEVLTMPYYDTPREPVQSQQIRPSMFRRTSSILAIPAMLKESVKCICDPTPLFHAPSKHKNMRAVFTTTTTRPFLILSLNDMACLIFGTSQEKAHSRSFLDFVGPQAKSNVVQKLECPVGTHVFETSTQVLLSGSLLDIAKADGNEGLAAVWVERQSHFLLWVVEELNADLCEVKLDQEGKPLSWEGSVPSPSMREVPNLLKATPEEDQLKHVALRLGNEAIPTVVSRNADKVRLRAPSVMAGAVVLDSNFCITSYNTAIMYYMLGIGRLQLVGQRVDALIPRFMLHLKDIETLIAQPIQLPGVVIPEHMFRQVACKDADSFYGDHPTGGVKALAKDGSSICVDVQLRVVDKSCLVLWLSYSRTPFSTKEVQMPSQLALYISNVAQSHHHHHASSASTASTVSSTVSSLPGSKPNTPPGTPRRSHSFRVGARRRELKLSDFDILQVLGEGAYGKVRLVRPKDDPTQEPVALKSIVKTRILVDTWSRDRQLGTIPNEIKIMNQLRMQPHPNIIELIDYFEDEECFHVEMPRAGNPGVDLFDYIEMRAKMSEAESRDIFRQVLSAVIHLHSLGIVHRDIKDENIIVDERGEIKLIDLGSAAYVSKGPFDVFVSTVDYAAPEILEGMPYTGPPQDIWALGILLFTVVYRETPFRDVDEIMAANIQVPYDMSVECTNLIHLLLRRNLETRPTAEEVLSHPWISRST